MKFVGVIILILLIATQAFSKWVLLLEFSMNRDFIAKNLCVNRLQPKLKCGGKCQLMKRLAEEEKENAPSQSPSGKSTFQEVLFTAGNVAFLPPPVIEEMTACYAPPGHWKLFFPPRSIFHPPLV